MAEPSESPSGSALHRCFPDCLPANALHSIAISLRNPAPLALTCRATAALLDQDELLLDWAATWSPRLAANTPISESRHPFYALLHWRRLRCMSTTRLGALLLRLTPNSTPSLKEAQPMLDAGGGLLLLRVLLPHSEPLLLMYAAQAGHTGLLGALLGDLLASGTPQRPVQLQWDATTSDSHSALQLALHAAVRSGQVEAMHMLLAALDASGECSGRYELAILHRSLIQTAAAGGARSTRALLALLQLCRPSTARAAARHFTTVNQALGCGDAVAVAALLATARYHGELPAHLHNNVLRYGHLHLLPLLRQAEADAGAEIDEEEVAANICNMAPLRRCNAEQLQLQLLPRAMWRIRRSDEAQILWTVALMAVMTSNNLPALHAIWAELTEAADRAVLARCMFAMLPRAQQANVAEWVLHTVRPALHSAEDIAAADVAVQQAALEALSGGRSDLLRVLQAPEVTAAFISTEQPWQLADISGTMATAARSGDMAAINTAHTALQAHMNENDLPDFMTMHDECICSAIEAGIRGPSPAAAVAAVRQLTWDYRDDPLLVSALTGSDSQLLLAHNGLIARTLIEQCSVMRAHAVGHESSKCLCDDALAAGNVELAVWLVAHPDQHATYLADLEWCEMYRVVMPGSKLLHSFIQLLHRLADGSACCEGSAVASSSAGGHIAGGSATCSQGGGSKGCGTGSNRRPPAGARQLTSDFLSDVVREGNPDLLYALLVFMDSCHAGC